MTSIHDLDRTDVATALAGLPTFRVDQVWTGLYSTFLPVAEIATLPADVRARLDAAHPAAAHRRP